MTFDLRSLQYRPLVDTCPRGDFRCGEADIDKWLLKDACKRHDNHNCRVTTVHIGDEADPVAFYALGLHLEEDRLLNGDGPIKRRVFHKVYPVLHLEYVAVHKDFQRRGIGSDMMGFVLEIFRRSVLDFGIPVLTLVPMTDKLVKFYGDLGFHPYAAHVGMRRMMLPAATILDMAAKAEAEIAKEHQPPELPPAASAISGADAGLA